MAGALYDLNIYNIHFTVGLFGKAKSIHYYANRGYNRVDTSGTAILTYKDFTAICTAAKDSYSPPSCIIQGEKGTLIAHGSPSTLRQLTLIHADGHEEALAQCNGDISLREEMVEFLRQYNEKDYISCYKMLKHSVAVVETIDACLSNTQQPQYFQPIK